MKVYGKTYGDLFKAVRSLREKENAAPFSSPEIDEVALLVAEVIIQETSFSMAHREWATFKNHIQREVAKAIRHTLFETPPFPDKN